jgi:hypothetical protein
LILKDLLMIELNLLLRLVLYLVLHQKDAEQQPGGRLEPLEVVIHL